MRVGVLADPARWSITTLLMTMYEWAAEHEPHIRAARAGTTGLRRVA